jgi:hypothetical protein
MSEDNKAISVKSKKGQKIHKYSNTEIRHHLQKWKESNASIAKYARSCIVPIPKSTFTSWTTRDQDYYKDVPIKQTMVVDNKHKKPHTLWDQETIKKVLNDFHQQKAIYFKKYNKKYTRTQYCHDNPHIPYATMRYWGPNKCKNNNNEQSIISFNIIVNLQPIEQYVIEDTRINMFELKESVDVTLMMVNEEENDVKKTVSDLLSSVIDKLVLNNEDSGTNMNLETPAYDDNQQVFV